MPLPHGGSIGVAIIHELGDALLDIPKDYGETKNRRAESESNKDTLHKKLSARFGASIDVGDYTYSDNWPMHTFMGVRAWLDKNSGLLWSARQEKAFDAWGPEQLQSAIDFC